jgi:hypothetical protein
VAVGMTTPATTMTTTSTTTPRMSLRNMRPISHACDYDGNSAFICFWMKLVARRGLKR